LNQTTKVRKKANQVRCRVLYLPLERPEFGKHGSRKRGTLASEKKRSGLKISAQPLLTETQIRASGALLPL